MDMTAKIVAVCVLVCAAMAVGCKKIEVTIHNHSADAMSVRITVPDGTVPLGAVSAGGRLSHTIKINNEDLPAQCSVSAGVGNSQSFTVTEDTKDKLWFHITNKGRLTGPYTKQDVHVETEKRGHIEETVHQETVVE